MLLIKTEVLVDKLVEVFCCQQMKQKYTQQQMELERYPNTKQIL